jgi:GntR family transcriptional regulator
MTPGRTASPLLIGPLSAAAGGPLYLQIVDRLKREISEGRLEAGAPLPSFRRLAEELLVSVITVKRAYEELERDGIIYRRQGLGTFVSEAAGDRSREAKTAHAAALFKQGAREAAEAGLPYKTILQLAETAIRQDADDQSGAQGATRHVRKRA